MIRLDKTNRKLQILLDASASTGVHVIVSFTDFNTENILTKGATVLTKVSGVSDTDICAAPAQGFIRNIDTFTICNPDSATRIATVKMDDNGTDYTIKSQTLTAGQTLAYGDSPGYQVF